MKIADHPHDRLRERTLIAPKELDALISRVRGMKLDPKKTYHYEWPDRGYAVIAPAREGQKHVVKTVLAPYMKPPGEKVANIYPAFFAELQKCAAVIAHISGPAGSGKSTVLASIAKDHPHVIVKDMDDFSRQAKRDLGFSVASADLTPAQKEQRQARAAELFKEFLSENRDRPVILGGIHSKRFWSVSGGPKPGAGAHIRLDTGALRSALRRYKRGERADEKSLLDIPRNALDARKTIKHLDSLGYAPMSPEGARALVRAGVK